MSKKKLTAVEKNKIEYDEFIKSLDGKTNEELLAIEQELIKTIDKHDRKVAKTQFKITDKEKYKEAVEIYRYFINQSKLAFNYVEGMLQLWNAFNPDKDVIEYPVLDLVLVGLGQLQFQGHDEWEKIMKFNEFTKPYSEEYLNLKSRTYLLAEEHSALQSKLGLTDPTKSNAK